MMHDDQLFPAGNAAPVSPAQQRWRAGLCRAVDGLMASAEGRDLLRWLLQAGLCFTAACPGPETPAGQISAATWAWPCCVFCRRPIPPTCPDFF